MGGLLASPNWPPRLATKRPRCWTLLIANGQVNWAFLPIFGFGTMENPRRAASGWGPIIRLVRRSRCIGAVALFVGLLVRVAARAEAHGSGGSSYVA